MPTLPPRSRVQSNRAPPAPTRRAALRLIGGVVGLALVSACRRAGDATNATPNATAEPSPPPPSPTPTASAASAAVSPSAAPAIHVKAERAAIVRGTLLGPGRIQTRTGESHNLLARIDLDAETPRSEPFALPFYGHGLAIDPRDAGRALVFEKHGPGCCLVDLRAGKTLAMVAAQPGRQFYGHGVFNRDGAYLFCTETYTEDGSMRGVIAVRDSNSLRWVADMPSYGEAPHDLVLAPDGRTLVVTNGGGSEASGHVPNVAWIDLRTRRLTRRLPFSSPRVNAGHVAIAASGAAAVVSAPRDGLDMTRPDVHGAISFWRREDGEDAKMRLGTGSALAKMRAETLSVAIHEPTGVAFCTSPKGNLLSFWDIATGTMMGATDAYPEPRGVAVSLDQHVVAISFGDGSQLALLDPWTWQPHTDLRVGEAFTSGAHLMFYRLDDAKRSGKRATQTG